MLETVLYSLNIILSWRWQWWGTSVVTQKYHGRTQHYLLVIRLIPLPEAICVAMAICNLVGKMLLTSMSNYSFIVCGL